MSKLAYAINYKATGDVMDLNCLGYQYTDVSVRASQPHSLLGFGREYTVSVKMSTTKWFDDSALIASSENEDAIKSEILSSIKRAMIEEIFGEFRPIIYELQSAIYDKNQNRMRQLTAELERKMFVEGI
jgi:hypothetical protein